MICIKAEKRSGIGSIAVRKYRKDGKIPANFYSKNVDNINVLVSTEEIIKVKSKRNCCVMSLEVGEEQKDVLIQDIQYHPVTMKPLHVDFLAINHKEQVKVNVPVRYLNTDKCVGIKQGGYLNKIYRRLPLVCLPADIPECIEIDTANFNIGKVIKISDINLPASVEPLKEGRVVVCNIIGRAKQQESEEAAIGGEQQQE